MSKKKRYRTKLGDKSFVTVKEASLAHGISETTINRYLSQGMRHKRKESIVHVDLRVLAEYHKATVAKRATRIVEINKAKARIRVCKATISNRLDMMVPVLCEGMDHELIENILTNDEISVMFFSDLVEDSKNFKFYLAWDLVQYLLDVIKDAQRKL